jgi:hypothetical protein
MPEAFGARFGIVCGETAARFQFNCADDRILVHTPAWRKDSFEHFERSLILKTTKCCNFPIPLACLIWS